MDTNPPKNIAIISLVLGIASLVGGIITLHIYTVGPYQWPTNKDSLIVIVYSLIPLFGLFLGKAGLQSTKRCLAIWGIILSLIGLIGTVGFYLFLCSLASRF